VAHASGGVVDERCPNCGAHLSAGAEVVCEYCGSRLRRLGPPPAPPPAAQVPGLHLRPYVLADEGVLGLEVLRMLVPADWQVSGGLTWDFSNFATPGVVALQVHNERWTEVFETFPPLWFYWGGGALPGAPYPGCEVRRPTSAGQLLRELVVPRVRHYADDLQVVGEQDAPALAAIVAARSPGARAEGWRTRVHYRFRDLAFDEEFFAGVIYVSVPTFGMMGMTQQVYWGPDTLFSVRAPVGHLDERAGLYQAMLHSIRVNPQWMAAYAQLKTQIAQGRIRHICQVGAIGRQIAAQGSQMREENLAGFEARQSTYDRLSLDWSQTIRGVDEYYDPIEGRSVELPSGYSYAWTNAFGECILTDNPNLDPNVGSNQTWQAMPRRGQ
jgi:hypothetical protein